jgi:hypothetical protein
MTKKLAAFRHTTRHHVAKIGMKAIMRVETSRSLQWWLVLPARGENDCLCMLLHKCGTANREFSITVCERSIIAEETARAAARLA